MRRASSGGSTAATSGRTCKKGLAARPKAVSQKLRPYSSRIQLGTQKQQQESATSLAWIDVLAASLPPVEGYHQLPRVAAPRPQLHQRYHHHHHPVSYTHLRAHETDSYL
eukprot:3508710-Pleurochrysis_carterae.AAC.1